VTILAYAAIYLIWGSTFLAIRMAIDSIPPLLMMGIRCVAAGLILVAVARFRGDRANARAWGHALVAGALMFAVCYGALAWAEERLATGVTALFVATVPFWMTLIDWGQTRVRPSIRTLVGLTLGLTGVALLVSSGLSTPLALLPAAALVVGEIAWAAGALYAKPRLPRSLMLNAGMPLTTGGLLLVAAAGVVGEFRGFHPRAVSLISIAAIGYLIVFGSIVAFSAYQWLLRIEPASRVGTHAYVNPLVAVALGGVFAGEPITTAILVSSLVIVSGVIIVGSGRRHAALKPVPSLRAAASEVRSTILDAGRRGTVSVPYSAPRAALCDE